MSTRSKTNYGRWDLIIRDFLQFTADLVGDSSTVWGDEGRRFADSSPEVGDCNLGRVLPSALILISSDPCRISHLWSSPVVLSLPVPLPSFPLAPSEVTFLHLSAVSRRKFGGNDQNHQWTDGWLRYRWRTSSCFPTVLISAASEESLMCIYCEELRVHSLKAAPINIFILEMDPKTHKMRYLDLWPAAFALIDPTSFHR